MKLKEEYERRVLTEIKGLSELEIEKILRMIHLVKEEFSGERRMPSVDKFKNARGAWKDVNVETVYRKFNEDWKRWTPARSV